MQHLKNAAFPGFHRGAALLRSFSPLLQSPFISLCQSYRYVYPVWFQRSFSKPIPLTISLHSSPRSSLLDSVYQIKCKLLVFISKAFIVNPALPFSTHLAARSQLPSPADHETSLSFLRLGSQTTTLTLSYMLPFLPGDFSF